MKFTSKKDCNLHFAIDSCVNDIEKQANVHIGFGYPHISFNFNLSNLHFRRKKESQPLIATEYSTEFFSRRMAAAFHGVRGLKEFTDKGEIKKRLSILLQQPLRFAPGIEGASTQPIWWFRNGYNSSILNFEILSHSKVLIELMECRIKRMLVYRDFGNESKEYVYVETYADKPCGVYKRSQEDRQQWISEFGYEEEEFAVFKPYCFLPSKNISRREYDDGATQYMGRHMLLNGKAHLRKRFLSPYNFIICAQGSNYNCSEFDITSEEVLNKMLSGTLSNKEFNDYMMAFPQRHALIR